ncbi:MULTISPECIES: MFS transporter [Streptomycetaceae]|uniref:Arabinose efflux permease family protein n=1 Tax=Streptantibioticus cattleyicolor (strain ATCC 35852 / DSM 46488 / JCM 4925 / NBRC 14057 / NRRL 8057) TaxID=1003195 RepID=F8JRW4_STREN|nr:MULTISPECIES: MFS transporter [Streptomycetaceae]AEW92873.1 arabinose efflux permease family protein [Streptantibioticus cattleyicolor NRRL 8057 = DSM 46488]MYS57627.1 MFS transporter [Streptomyces sp. SID5468]CCB73231.1 Arabinose efflux permease family protein [Streptantibioticus cattleyicolor NRRL 8057 = DSM 46488]
MMLPFSVTGAAMALPSMAAHLGSSAGAGQWMLNAFNITFAAVPLAAGGLADRFGRRRVLLTGIALVGVVSLLVALAPSMALVDVARAVQGCGAAAVLSSGAAVLAHSTSGRRRQLAFGFLGTSFGTGLAIGPLVAGALVEAAGWRSVFILVAAMSMPAWLCATRAPESRNPDQPALDAAGLVTFTAGLACLSFAFVRAGAAGWSAPGTLLPLAAAVAFVALFAVVEVRLGDRAVFDVRLFRRPELVAVVCQPFTVTLGFVILLVYLPAYLQGVADRSIVASGLLLLPMTAPVLLLPLAAGHLAARTSVRAVLTGASALIVVCALLLTTLRSDGSWPALALPLLPLGAGVGLAFGVMDNAAVSTVPVENAGAAAGIFNTMRSTGESVAVAGAAALLTTLTAAQLHGSHLPSDSATRIAAQAVQGQVPAAHHAALAAGFTHAFHTLGLLLAALSTLGALLTYFTLAPQRSRRPE